MLDPAPLPLDRVTLVVPAVGKIRDVLDARALLPFSEPVLRFAAELGRALRQDRAARAFPEIVALGYWLRPGNLAVLRQRFENAHPDAVRLPRGVALHIAPSNVDTIFVYSLLVSMLAGNVNVVRLSSRAGDQADALMTLLRATLAQADSAVRERLAIVRYDHDAAITDALSARVALRIIWGGDRTVALIRASPIGPGAVDLAFPDKMSLAAIDAAAWLGAEDRDGIARRFANDGLWFGQMACSSPRSLVWRGDAETVAAASADFWPRVEAAVRGGPFDWADAHATAKLVAEQDLAIGSQVTILPGRSNRVRVVRGEVAEVNVPTGAGNGFFREAQVERLAELLAVAAPHWQTIATFGIDRADWAAALADGVPQGIARIVPIGTALDFDVVWDGRDLLTEMTRLVSLPR
jgi:hypothetical protein